MIPPIILFYCSERMVCFGRHRLLNYNVWKKEMKPRF